MSDAKIDWLVTSMIVFFNAATITLIFVIAKLTEKKP